MEKKMDNLITGYMRAAIRIESQGEKSLGLCKGTLFGGAPE